MVLWRGAPLKPREGALLATLVPRPPPRRAIVSGRDGKKTGFGGQLGDLPLPRAYNSIASWPLCELFPCCLTSLLRNNGRLGDPALPGLGR